MIIGHGRAGRANQTQWNVQTVSGNNNDIWTEVLSPDDGTYTGYKSVTPDDDVKRWGKNQIADEDCLFNNCSNDNDLRGNLQLTLGGGLGAMTSSRWSRNSIASKWRPGERSAGGRRRFWLGRVLQAQRSMGADRHRQCPVLGLSVDNQSTANAVYGNYTTFADMSYYRSEILNIMNANPNYSVMGDINLDGVVTGSTAGGVPTGDIAAFVAGWGYDNGTGVGTVTSWKNGDLNRDGKTDVADFVLLRTALNPPGAGRLLARFAARRCRRAGTFEPAARTCRQRLLAFLRRRRRR